MKASYRTPQKQEQQQQPRSAESSNRRSKETQLKRGDSHEPLKRSQKIVGKCLNSEFTSVSEELSLETKESIDSSPDSEINDCNQPIELLEIPNFVLLPNPTTSAPFETIDQSGSLTIIDDKQETESRSSNSENLKAENVEVQVLVDLLREARFQLSVASEVDRRSKKILDALIEIVIEDLYEVREERDNLSELISAKVWIGFFCFVLWIVFVSVVFFFNSGTQSSFSGSPPS